VKVRALRWGVAGAARALLGGGGGGGEFELVVGSDVLYDPAAAEALLPTIAEAIGQHGAAVIGSAARPRPAPPSPSPPPTPPSPPLPPRATTAPAPAPGRGESARARGRWEERELWAGLAARFVAAAAEHSLVVERVPGWAGEGGPAPAGREGDCWFAEMRIVVLRRGGCEVGAAGLSASAEAQKINRCTE
jgi:hypothetical protein